MAKKSNRKQAVSEASRRESNQSEQTQSIPQHAKSSPHSPTTQRISSAAPQGDIILPQLNHTEELPPAVRCAHNIALLELLDPRPEILVSKPQIDSTQQDDEGRVLSIRQERELATNLAFLAGISNSPDHIMGVCIEELPGVIKGCQVMVSINQRRPSDGKEILKKVQKGFEQIFDRLSYLSAESSTQERLDVKETVFNDIVALCHPRILGRLKSKHSKAFPGGWKLKKRFVGSVLRQFMEGPWKTRAEKSGFPEICVHDLNDYQQVLKNLLEDLEQFEAEDLYHHKNLLRLVRSFSQAFESVPIKALLASLNEDDMTQKQRDRLYTCFAKIHRYSQVAHILCHRARRIPMLRNIRVRIVSDVVKLEGTSALSGNIMDIWKYLARSRYKGESVQEKMLPEWLRCLTQSSVDSHLKSVRGILKEAKVHAEIQLLAHYENGRVKCCRPRILASSKKACALCNTIITIHGEYNVPGSHGRLYKGWKLAAAHQNGALQKRLNEVLERSISDTLERLMPLPRRPRVDFENESSIYSFTLSASTLPETSASTVSNHSDAAAEVVDGDLASEGLSNKGHVSESVHTESSTTGEAGDGIEDETEDDSEAMSEAISEDISEEISEGSSEGSSEDISEENDSACASEHTDDQANGPLSHNSISIDGSTTSLSRRTAVVRLEHGQTILFDPEQDGMSCFRGNRIEMIIDETSSRLSFELLGATEAEAVLRDETKPKADVRTMSCGMDVLLPKCADGQVYITHGKEVIRICARPG